MRSSHIVKGQPGEAFKYGAVVHRPHWERPPKSNKTTLVARERITQPQKQKKKGRKKERVTMDRNFRREGISVQEQRKERKD